MARIFFVGVDGAEKSYRLQTHRPFTLGRDPGNDIILRDPKVSRHHAEIIFERGFFVVHDLASANGTWINGKRVRVAPLTNGARLRLGNTQGHFSEEIPTDAGAAVEADAPLPEPPQPPTEDLDEIGHEPDFDRVHLRTIPHQKLSEADAKKKAE